nr:hypothetical protein [Nocardia amamiensis]
MVQARFVQAAVLAVDVDESGGLGGFAAVDHRAGAGFLGIQRLGVAAGGCGRVLPYRPPRLRMVLGIPYRFSALSAGVDGAAGMARGDGVDDLTVGENVTVPMEMRRQIRGAVVTREPTINDNPAASSSFRFVTDSMLASAATIQVWAIPWRA